MVFANDRAGYINDRIQDGLDWIEKRCKQLLGSGRGWAVFILRLPDGRKCYYLVEYYPHQIGWVRRMPKRIRRVAYSRRENV